MSGKEPLLIAVINALIFLYLLSVFYTMKSKLKACKIPIIDVKNYGFENWAQSVTFTYLLIWGFNVLAHSDNKAWYIVIPLFQIAIILLSLIDGFRKSRFKIYENAINFPLGIVKWHQIVEHEWEDNNRDDLLFLVVTVKKEKSITRRKTKKMKVKIMRLHKDTIEECFQKIEKNNLSEALNH